MIFWYFWYAYVKMPLINAHADLSIGTRGLSVCLSLHLHPYFVYASSAGSSESADMRRLA